jgi:hypothetical protein
MDEEYEADDLLTELAESRVNEKAILENGGSGSCCKRDVPAHAENLQTNVKKPQSCDC